MRNHTTIALTGILLLAGLASSAQELVNPRLDTVRWEYRSIENRVRSEMVSLRGHFISYAGNSFLWIQDGVDRKYTFYTKSVTGNWTNAGRAGELVYRVTCNGEDGTLRLIRTRRAIIVELDFLLPNKRTPHLYLLVNSIQKI